ncbi:TPA: hypothetical protein U5E00_004266 [Yersinia enterocolitica]|uniref:hypothetical protein n=1 Tax=Yersinia enterocolitica TaxID=630 RepID=UPI0005E82334|nr:hypothetical protein [Yersinia enterocolitica]EKN3942725.1 hypothetical protein [Yersinia enterocolitica]MBW5850203.1 hypothetical protein [Yersinia enterocolitica]CNJ74411.1 phage-like protein [Yersinia enterocolitica]HDL6527623.1 hypothetical protein [Yersinia enterocolitica]HDL6731010.1 hypothetical protein [Yersinia enterocolitica]
MSNLVEIKSTGSNIIINVATIDSVMDCGEYRQINQLSGEYIRTMATLADITAALIPAKQTCPTAEEYSDSETIAPSTLGEKVTIHRRRYFNNGEMAGYLFYGVTGYASKEEIAEVFEKLPR